MILYQRGGIFCLPSDVPHCCLWCGFVPIEGMKRYLAIHGDDAACVTCREKLPHDPPFVDPYEGVEAKL